MEQENISEELRQISILLRVNNLLMSKFIVQLANVRKELGLPPRNSFFKFELLDEDYESLSLEFGKQEVDKALYKLDRLLLQNKQNCPHNIKKYLRTRLKKKGKRNNKDESNS